MDFCGGRTYMLSDFLLVSFQFACKCGLTPGALVSIHAGQSLSLCVCARVIVLLQMLVYVVYVWPYRCACVCVSANCMCAFYLHLMAKREVNRVVKWCLTMSLALSLIILFDSPYVSLLVSTYVSITYNPFRITA